MIALAHKIVIAIGAALLTACVFVAAYLSQPLLLLLPIAVVAALFFIQHPRLLLYTLLASIPPSFEYSFNESLGTDLPDEPLMLLTAFVALSLLAWRRKKFDKALFSQAPVIFLLLGFAWLLVTMAASTFPLFSLKYLAAKSWYLLAFVALPLLLKGDKSLVRNAAVVLFASMFTMACVVLYHHAELSFTFANINEAVSPFFRNHVNYSALLVLMTPLQFAFLRLSKNRGLRSVIFLSILVVLAALYLSYSRGAWLALVIGLGGLWLIKRGWLFKSFLAMVTIVALAVGGLVYQNNYLQFAPNHNNTVFHLNFSEHLEATYQGKDVSTAERFYRWVAGARMSADKPLTGFGPTTFYQNYKTYAVPAFRTWVSANYEHSTVHNYFLLLLIEQGIPGLLLFVLLLAALFWQAQKIYNRSNDVFWKATVATVGAILLMQCTLNFLSDLVETDKVGSVFYLCVAVLVISDGVTRIRSTNCKDS